MGRPRLHHTPEEQAEANRTKSKHYYEKKKFEINKKRRRLYAREARSSEYQYLEEKKSTNNAPNLKALLAKAQQALVRIGRLSNEKPDRDFLDSIVHEFDRLSGGDGSSEAMQYLSRQGESFSAIHASVIAVHDQVLQHHGVGDALSKVAVVAKRVKCICGWIQDIECVAIVNIKDVLSYFKRGELLYQVDLHPV
ncbi:hypothetical protein BKA70DRAFT_1419457 [Coprinopsis sp. MPI-PUGE-AT-0042]|nr:hypothetical protein BKA70DRAFT_1419457 [Coprinopsis sp. MPI-PUGE-AT-0042]